MQTRNVAAMRAQAEHYAQSCYFLGMFDANSFDEEVETDVSWQGFNRDATGMLQLAAEFVFDAGQDSGRGWYL